MRVDKTQSSSFNGTEERGAASGRLSESMADFHEQPPLYLLREQQQVLRDNSTESEEPPATTTSPPPPQLSLSNGVSGGRGCPQENQHAGKELLNTMVQLPIEMVFNLLFLQEQFMIDIYGMKKTYDVVFEPWEEQDDGHRSRQATYTMTLPLANLGPKVSYITEKQVILSSSKPGEAYVVELEATNSGIPYADSFVVASHYCLAKEDESKTRLGVWVSIKYKKTVWGLVKTMIEKNTYNGVEGLLAEVVTQLGTEADRLAAPKLGGRRRKRIISDKNSVGAKHATTPSHAPTDGGEGASSMAVVVMAVALVLLAAGNAILYSRLSRLERQSHLPDAFTPTTRYLSVTGSWEVVARLLQRQEEMHYHQLGEWKARLQQATKTLREVQESLETILRDIPEHEQELQQVLQQQSSDVLAGWLQTEDALKKQLSTSEPQDSAGQRDLAQEDTSGEHPVEGNNP